MILSHPDKTLLQDHQRRTMEWGIRFLSDSPYIKDKTLPDGLVSAYLYLHDIGKSTKNFQKYMAEVMKGSHKLDKDPLKQHSSLSAIVFLEYCSIMGYDVMYQEAVFAMYYAIRRHHGPMLSVRAVKNGSDGFIIEEQWEELANRDEIAEIMSLIMDIDVAESIVKADAEHLMSTEEQFLRRCRNIIDKKEQCTKLYYVIKLFYSTLLDADKCSVTLGECSLPERINLDIIDVASCIDKSDSYLSKMRTQAFEEVDGALKDNYKEYIYEITLPTGMGKTFTSLNAAFKLRKYLRESTKSTYRIIYILPFMSIIDQNAEKVLERKILSKYWGEDKLDNYLLLKYHHLSEINWRDSGESELYSPVKAKSLMDSFSSEIIVTTFVQFFESLLGVKNSNSRKVNKFQKSIVIIDEIQALPYKYYEFIRYMLKDYVRMYDSRLIITTATQPKIFDRDELFSLCDSRKYYGNVNRVTMHNKTDIPMTIAEFVDSISVNKDETVLFVVNTIKCAVDLHRALVAKIDCDVSEIGFLSSLLTPGERLKRIDRAKNKGYKILVSTQLVEAGVDIDFDIVYRDFAPLVSLIQSAGRANREWNGGKKGQVYFIELIYGDNKRYSDLIYKRLGKVDLLKTKEVLSSKNKYSEIEFYDIINDYYYLLEESKSQEESRKLLNGIYGGWYNDCNDSDSIPVSEFKLIDESYDKFNIFVEEDELAANLWEKYINMIDGKEYIDFEDQVLLQQLERKMAKYVVSCAAKKNFVFPPDISDNSYYRYVPINDIKRYYDSIYGFGIEDFDPFF